MHSYVIDYDEYVINIKFLTYTKKIFKTNRAMWINSCLDYLDYWKKYTHIAMKEF